MGKLFDILRNIVSPGNPETLEEKADRLEKQALELENDARLRKRIADAEKRIKAVKPSGGILGNVSIGGSGVRGGLVKAIVVVTLVVIIILVIATKAC